MVSNDQLLLPLPKYSKFKVALCQLKVTSDKEKNIAHARKSIEDAARKRASLVVLLEIWNCPCPNENFNKYAEDIDAEDASRSILMLSEVAYSQGITIIGGSIPEISAGRLFNTCCVISPDEKLKAKHRQLHLFDVDIPGDITFGESDILTAGAEPTVIDTARESDGSYEIWGHSSLVDPFGEIVATSGHEEATVIAEVDYSQIHLRRANLPLEMHNDGFISLPSIPNGSNWA